MNHMPTHPLFDFNARLGEGGFGTVYKVQRRDDNAVSDLRAVH